MSESESVPCPGGKGRVSYNDEAGQDILFKERGEKATRHLTIEFSIDCESCQLHQVCRRTEIVRPDTNVDRVVNQVYSDTLALCRQPTARRGLGIIK